MKRLPPRRCATVLALGLLCAGLPLRASRPQDDVSAVAVLRSRARTLEQRGRFDLARQDWSQVLGVEPTDAEALAGLVRAARAANQPAEAEQYLARLRAAHPQDPELARLEAAGKPADSAVALLHQAAQLARSGDNRGAMVLYHRVYGSNPPAGPAALPFYETESATEEGRPHAIAGLRALVDQFPAQTEYAVVLGRVLLASPRTRAEGRSLLERFPQNSAAIAALHGAPAVSPMAAATAEPVHAAVGNHPPLGAAEAATARPLPQPARPTVTTVAAHSRTANTEAEQAAFAALNAHQLDQAERAFEAILADNPADARALAGMGYVQSTRGNLKAAVNFFERAQESGDRSLALTRALVNTQFEYTLQKAAAARTRKDLPGAEDQYRAALRERPSDPTALDGLAETLLDAGKPREAAPVFVHLTEVRPLSPAAWRGAVIAEVQEGDTAVALATDARVPQDVRAPLLGDPAYTQAITAARGQGGVQTATVQPPPRPGAAAAPVARTAQPAAAPATRPSAPVSQPSPTTAAAPKAPASPSPSPRAATPPAEGAGGRSPQPAPEAARPTPAPSSAPPDVAKTTTPPSPASVPPSPAPSAATRPPAAPPVAAGSPVPSPTPRPAAPFAAPPQGTPAPALPPAQALAENTRPSAPSGRSSARARAGRTRAAASAQPLPAPAPTPAASRAPVPAPVLTAAETIAAERTTQGEAALLRGENVGAAALFRDAVSAAPERPDAWRGLVLALSRADRDREAVSTVVQIPTPARAVLDHDATFLDALGQVYVKAGRPAEAVRPLARAQEIFAAQNLAPPLGLLLRLASLLAARGDDANLYRELMYLGSRRDLTDAQRSDVQMIWTDWAVRRARTLAAAGEQRRAVVMLNATAEAFNGNPRVVHAVANGYAGVGLPREAVALFKAEDLAQAPAREVETAIAAAVAARDFHAAEGWVRQGRDRFPSDPEMLTAAAEYEQARGHQGRAAELSRQAKELAPAQDPGLILLAELREAPAGTAGPAVNGGRLATLLAPADAQALAAQGNGSHPFLPALSEGGPAQGQAALTPVLAGYDEPTR